MTSEPARDEPIDDFLKRQFGPDIQPGREDRILREDPGLAGRVARLLDAEPSPEGVIAPITLGLPASLPPIAYVMHVWTHKCSMCQSEHKHSEVFGLNHLRSRTGAGNFVRNMSPVGRLEWNVPLQVHNLTTRTTAGCFECLDALRYEILSTLPSPPVPVSTPRADLSGAQAPARLGSAPKRPMTTDDFMV